MFLMNVLFSESPVPSKLVLPAFGSWVVEWGKVSEYGQSPLPVVFSCGFSVSFSTS